MCASRRRSAHAARLWRVDLLFALALIVLLGAARTAVAQLPATQLSGVYPAGGAPGSKFDVTIAGANLDNVARLLFSHPGITAEVKMDEPGPFDAGPQPMPNRFVVTVAADVPPGQYDVRTEGMYGVSNPRVFDINTLAEQVEREPNN